LIFYIVSNPNDNNYQLHFTLKLLHIGLMQYDVSQTNVLSVNAVSFTYQGARQETLRAINDVSFTLKQGEFFSLLGPSGCGKSTLLRLIAGLQSPDKGVIDIHSMSNTPRKVGMVFQDLALFPHMTVAKNIEFAIKHMPRADRKTRIDEVLHLVRLTTKRDHYPHTLSGGQQQRLALARSLAPKPDLILLDEPFASQDVSLRRSIRNDVIDILKQSDVAAILVTHDPEEAMYFADRMAIMRAGHIEQIGTPQELYQNPMNAFVASFFGDINIVEGVIEKGFLNTPVGVIPAHHFQEGANVQAVIRPEAIKIQSHDPAIDHHSFEHAHTHALLRHTRYLGQSTQLSLITKDIDDGQAVTISLNARIPDMPIDANTQNDLYDIFVDNDQVLLFEKK